MAKNKGSKGSSSAPREHAPPTTDARFARLHTDPRFLRPQRDDAKVAVDERFKGLLGGKEGFGIHKQKAKVDRFGRKMSKGKSKEDEEMGKLYKAEQPEDTDESEEEEEEEDEEDEKAGPIDYARGAVELESSGDESSSEEESEGEGSDSDSGDETGDVAIGSAAVLRRERRRRAQRGEEDDDDDDDSDDDDDDSDDDDENIDEEAEKEIDPRALAALDAQAERVVAAEASEAGPSSSKAAAKRSKRKQATIEPGSETKRLAVVNMDWDHVRALDIYKVFSSLVSPHATRLPGTDVATTTAGSGHRASSSQQVKGLVESVRIYPSDFGRERMKREDIEGPPKDIFKSAEDGETAARRKAKKKSKGKKKRADSDEDDEDDAVFEVDEGAEFDEEALRKYQLDRLRYYYAIATFDSPLSARHVYDVVDGAEMERTANIFDLQFVPDEMDFPEVQDSDDVQGWRDEAKPGLDDAAAYRGADWATDALRHSKVKLTWDAPDPERMKVTRMGRQLTKGEIRDDDFRAYLASDSEDGESDEAEQQKPNGKGKGATAGRDRFRALMGLDGEEAGTNKGGVFGKSRSSAFEDARDDNDGEDGDMEITFLPGLSEAAARKAAGGSASKDGEKEETTLEKYMRKQREKKERRKAARAEQGLDDEDEEPQKGKPAPAAAADNDLGFDDPFFASGGEEDGEDLDAILAKEQAKEAKAKIKKPNPSNGVESRNTSALAEDDDNEDEGRHFSMQDVLKAESSKNGKKPNRWERKKLAKLAKRQAAENGDVAPSAALEAKKKLEAQPDFKLDTADPRFFSAATLDDHRFAVDPTHPSFMKTEGMTRALEERRKRGGGAPVEEGMAVKGPQGKKRKQEQKGSGADDTSELLASIKRREQQQQGKKGIKGDKKRKVDK
ncbi:hypothetical protein BDZ90DRAFT_232358 [Jaminaea rosea]|uniref:Uncharacterized protein n=1 Tax=Jaminaea rosea TaxID=1569628 RepID=A0A316UPZ5_9BASI|nr:hypothetical protein BDZ90DRAFT_232358 [Jaminaea rosea]PWN27382.1 hypothetical protein BDZ90DRAFT_232358 [Jaminaea rosea]